MGTLRFLGRLLGLVALVLLCLPPHLVARLRGRSPWPRRFLRWAARIAGFEVRIAGRPMRHDVFYVANHLSWIDILALGGATGCAFISKDSVATAPIVGWLAAQNATIYVARERRGEVSAQIASVREAIAAHQPIALFPEGTTGDGRALLPFKPALFAVLIPPPRAISIQPVVIDYGAFGRRIAWKDGESSLANARRVLGSAGAKPLTLHFLDPFDPGTHPDRKALAAETRKRIEAAQGAFAAAPAPV